jgi:hypothetical protein
VIASGSPVDHFELVMMAGAACEELAEEEEDDDDDFEDLAEAVELALRSVRDHLLVCEDRSVSGLGCTSWLSEMSVSFSWYHLGLGVVFSLDFSIGFILDFGVTRQGTGRAPAVGEIRPRELGRSPAGDSSGIPMSLRSDSTLRHFDSRRLVKVSS